MLRILVTLLALSLTGLSAQADRPLTVFAAASLREAMEEIGRAFEAETGTKVVFSFAGTGTLARQIEAGAPADVFVSADREWMDYVADRGAVRPDTMHTIAGNALVLVGEKGSPPLVLTQEALLERLQGLRLAMADTESVPAGRYGRAALEGTGLWPAVRDRLASMENVRVALAAVARGETALGLVYATDAAVEPAVDVVSVFPRASHPDIRYPAAATSRTHNAQAMAFLSFLSAPKAVNILHSLGFLTDNGG